MIIGDRITVKQKEFISSLLEDVDYPTNFVSLLYRNIGAKDSWIGRPVGEWLDTLSKQDASRVIAKLKEFLSDNDQYEENYGGSFY